jgi:hypothetical protein
MTTENTQAALASQAIAMSLLGAGAQLKDFTDGSYYEMPALDGIMRVSLDQPCSIFILDADLQLAASFRLELRAVTDAQYDELEEVKGWDPEVIYTNVDAHGDRWFIRDCGDHFGAAVFSSLIEAACAA